MTLYTSRLLLRPVAQEDLGDLFAIYGDPATNTFNPAGPYPDIAYTQTVLDRWLAHWQSTGLAVGRSRCATRPRRSSVLVA